MASNAWIRRRYWVRVELNLGFGSLVVQDYTGLLTRRLVTECSRLGALALNKPGGPKPLSVTPLYRKRGSRIEAVYPRFNGGKLAYPIIEHGEELFFEVGTAPSYDAIHDDLADCLREGIVVTMWGQHLHVALLGAETVAVYHGRESKPLYTLRPGRKVRLVFASPAQLVSIVRLGSTWRIYTPAPYYLFSINALDLHGGSISGALYSLLQADESLSPAPSIHSTTRVVLFRIEGRREPGLIGYVNLYILEAPEESLEETAHLLSHAAVMGIGASRAAGLGAVMVRVV